MLEFPKLGLKLEYRCVGCGGCCQRLFGKRFGAAVTSEEKMRLEILASRRAVQVHFYPLTKDFAGNVTTWQFSDDKCPFYDAGASRAGGQHCTIYRWRPLLCRAYPLMPYGVADCSSLERSTRLFHVFYTPDQIQAGTLYMKQVASRIKSAAYIYDINANKWRVNKR